MLNLRNSYRGEDLVDTIIKFQEAGKDRYVFLYRCKEEGGDGPSSVHTKLQTPQSTPHRIKPRRTVQGLMMCTNQPLQKVASTISINTC